MKKRLLLCSILACCTAAPAIYCAETASESKKPVVLLTGFEPFGRVKINASWESVKTLQGREILGYRIETALLPVVYDEMDAPLQAAIEKYKPDVVVSFGVGTAVVQVETIAFNGYHFWMPKDNKGNMPPRLRIDSRGPDLPLRTRLPVNAIMHALRDAHIGAATSTDAGGYLCNECFYRLLSGKNTPLVSGFVHVPEFGRPDPAGGVFSREKLSHAVQVVVEATLSSIKRSAP